MRTTALIPFALIALVLTGCSSAAATPEPAAPDADCLTVTEGVQAALQGGLDTKGAGYTVTNITAIEDDGAWWVAADMTGDPDVTAVWYTQQDPTTADDAAFISATNLASLTSMYLMPEDLTGADPINEATACLN